MEWENTQNQQNQGKKAEEEKIYVVNKLKKENEDDQFLFAPEKRVTKFFIASLRKDFEFKTSFWKNNNEQGFGKSIYSFLLT